MKEYDTLKKIGASPGDVVENNQSTNKYEVLEGLRLKHIETGKIYKWDLVWDHYLHDVWKISRKHSVGVNRPWIGWVPGEAPVTEGEVEVMWARRPRC